MSERPTECGQKQSTRPSRFGSGKMRLDYDTDLRGWHIGMPERSMVAERGPWSVLSSAQ